MKIFPAIDLYDKKAVRLLRGDYNQMTVYSDNPVDVAKDFEKQGAEFIHLVDLEGAKYGTTPNIDIVTAIVESTNLFVEIGGGIRSMETIDQYVKAGVSRVILGTSAVENKKLLKEAVIKYSDKIAVGADIKDGYIAIKGWIETSKVILDDFLAEMKNLGVKNIICTDISKDGAMNGTNVMLYKKLSEKCNLDITASGGISSVDDIKCLAGMNLYGAIIGKAYYTGAIDLKTAIEVAK